MDPIIISAVIASGVVFLFVLAWKIAWFVHKMSEGGEGQAAESRTGGEKANETPREALREQAAEKRPERADEFRASAEDRATD